MASTASLMSMTNTYSYDCNGSQTNRYVSGTNYTLGYDAENRLITVSGGATAAFTYNAAGTRVKTSINGQTTVYIGSYAEWNVNTSPKWRSTAHSSRPSSDQER